MSINSILYPDTLFVNDSISQSNIVASTSSTLACYWPYIVALDETGGLAVVKNEPFSDVIFAPTSNWTVTSLGVTPMAGTKLSLVALGVSMATLESDAFGVVYQDIDGYLALSQPSVTDSWPNGKYFSKILQQEPPT